MFAKIRKADLKSIDNLNRWLDWQSKQPNAVFRKPNDRILLEVVGAAVRAVKVGDNPPALFAKLVGGKCFDKITNEQEEAARKMIVEWRRTQRAT